MSTRENVELQKEQEFIDRLYDRVDTLRGDTAQRVEDALTPVGNGLQARLERDVLVAERSGLLAALNAVDGSLCFGRIDLRDGAAHHIGRIGIREDDTDHTPLLIDWRAPVARPFYLATGHTPMGLRRRRHLTTEGRTVTELHDEILDLGDRERTGFEDPSGDAVLLAALSSARTGRMGDIVRTIQAEQDRIIRAPHRGVLVVEEGRAPARRRSPCTGRPSCCTSTGSSWPSARSWSWAPTRPSSATSARCCPRWARPA